MKARLLAIVIILVFFMASSAFAAQISGKAYEWYSLDQLDGVIVSINTTPQQTNVTQNGFYSFQVNLGDYQIHAEYIVKGVKVYEADENITIQDDGNYTIDLILFPSLTDPDDGENPTDPGAGNLPIEYLALAGIIIIGIIGSAIWFKKNQKNKENNSNQKIESASVENTTVSQELADDLLNHYELDKYALEVLEVLKKSGNRLTQKEIREKITDIGEAKISLILTELEDRKLIKKIKKGRGNIVILIDSTRNGNETILPEESINKESKNQEN